MENENKSLSSPQLALCEQSGVVVALSTKQIISLYKKSEQSDIPFDTLREVYERGFKESLSEQIAFNRVNSFIAGGAAMLLDQDLDEKRGLWDNIHAKRERIKHGSGEHMRKPGSKGAPTKQDLIRSQNEEYLEESGESLVHRLSMHASKGHDEHYKRELRQASSKTLERAARYINKVKGAKGPEIAHLHHVETELKRKKEKYDKSPYAARKAIAAAKANEEYTGAEKVSKNSDDPSSRFIGTDSLTNVYKKATPGYAQTIKRVVREHCGCKDSIEETEAWQKSKYKSPKGGMTEKGVEVYRREHPGSKLKTAVTTKPSKLKAGSKAANRRKSFCARMGGVEGPMKKPNGEPTRKALALRKWNC